MVLLALVSVAWLPAQRAPAADTAKETTSLRFVPADVSFYATSLLNREKFDAVVKSKAFAKLKAMPVVQTMLAEIQRELDAEGNPFAQFKLLLELPENQQLLELFGEMVSDEVFVYGDAGWADMFLLLAEFNRVQREISFKTLRRQPGDFGNDQETALLLGMFDALKKHLDKLQVPDMVIGFKVKDQKKAATQLARLEVVLKMLIAEAPPLKNALKRTQVRGSDFLTFVVDGSMVPWDEAPLDEDQRKKYADVIAKIKKMTLTASIGVMGDYVMLSIGDTNEHLASLGTGDLLIDHKKMAPLAKLTDQRLSGVAYVSETFVKSAGSPKQSINDMTSTLKGILPLAELDADIQERLGKDIDELGKDLAAFIPEPGAAMSFSYLTDRGIEGYTHSWTQNLFADGSQKLSILDHAGGDPLVLLAGRAKPSTQGYEFLVKWAKKGHQYFELMAVPEMSEKEQADYQKVKEKFAPLVERLHKTTVTMLLPALKDGQSACIFDAKLKSTQWFEGMPASDKPLPLPEIGFVVGVSDVDLLKKAFSEYVAIVEEAVDQAREIFPNEVPPFTFPRPKTRQFETSSGTFDVYYYTFPVKWGIHNWLAPNAGLSKKFAAVTLAPLHTKRLLEDKPLAVGGPLAKFDRPLAGAAHFNWAGIVDAASPWVEYGFDVQMKQMAQLFGGDVPPEFKAQMDSTISQVRTGMAIARCFRGFSSVTYVGDDKEMVSHFEWRFKDLE